jgi:hypothetical protein
MKTFNCTCASRPALFFENTSCNACGRVTGLTDDFKQVKPFDLDEESGYFKLQGVATKRYKKCHNFANHQACNGMIEVGVEAPQIEGVIDFGDLCFACQFNELIPDLGVAGHLPLWQKLEAAKRRALYTLNALPIPLNNLRQSPEAGLSFDFTTDRNVQDHFASRITNQPAVMTGHNCGHITINLAEADDVSRATMQSAMGEQYRTLLGHFRHELGHYYFDQLIAVDEKKHALCKKYFGDDELDYQEALDKHYNEGAPTNWPENFISEYASMHPWEDWAETWAHYMHIIDTLETAKNYGMVFSEKTTADSNRGKGDVNDLNLPQNQNYFYFQSSFTSIIDAWVSFSIMLNSLNRSMGLQDAYPFVLSPSVRNKLMFIHHAIHNKLANLDA